MLQCEVPEFEDSGRLMAAAAAITGPAAAAAGAERGCSSANSVQDSRLALGLMLLLCLLLLFLLL
jgi:hypothetical protein